MTTRLELLYTHRKYICYIHTNIYIYIYIYMYVFEYTQQPLCQQLSSCLSDAFHKDSTCSMATPLKISINTHKRVTQWPIFSSFKYRFNENLNGYSHSIRIQHVQWLPPLGFQSILINESLNGQSIEDPLNDTLKDILNDIFKYVSALSNIEQH